MHVFPLALWVAVAGALGTLCRFAANRAALALLPHQLPLATLAVNATGCLLFGVAASLLPLPSPWRIVVLSGFLGAFTTFSAYVFEADALARQAGGLPVALGYLALQNGLGFAALWAGATLGGRLLGKAA